MSMAEAMNKRERILAAVAAAVLLTAPVYTFLISPMLDRWKGVTIRIQAVETRLEKGRRLLVQEEAIRAAHKRLVEPYRQAGSDPEEMGRFLKEVEQLASRSLMKITDIRPLPISEADGHKIFTLELETRADTARLIRFIYSARQKSAVLHVDRMSIASSRGAPLTRLQLSRAVLPAPDTPPSAK